MWGRNLCVAKSIEICCRRPPQNGGGKYNQVLSLASGVAKQQRDAVRPKKLLSHLRCLRHSACLCFAIAPRVFVAASLQASKRAQAGLLCYWHPPSRWPVGGHLAFSPKGRYAQAVNQPSILMVAGEASADAHGAQVLGALKAQYGAVSVFGVGGPALRAQGMETLIDASDMSLAGITEVLWALPRMVRTLWALTRAARERRPVVAVLLDLPDFNLPLAKRLKKLGIPVVYYISPQVWAWRAGRVRHIRRWVDKMLVILPFEEAFYQSHSVQAEFVGHPLTEHLPELTPEEGQGMARSALSLAIGRDDKVLALLPGSRKKEVSRHLPTMLAAAALLRRNSHPSLKVLVPVASTIDATFVEELVTASGQQVVVLRGQARQALMACDAAMVCSGTATLETALVGRPMVVVYRVSFLSYHILRRLISVAHIALVNLIAQERLVPELVQGDMTANALAQTTASLLKSGPSQTKLMQRLRDLRHVLGYKKPSRAVARAIQTYLPAHGGPTGVDHG